MKLDTRYICSIKIFCKSTPIFHSISLFFAWEAIFESPYILSYAWNCDHILISFNSTNQYCSNISDSSTCSYTLPTREQRWWQVQLQPRSINDVSTVSRIHVLTSPPSSVESVAVFVIKLLGSKAEYKQCHSLHLLNETNNGYMQFDCYQEHGEFVYIRWSIATGYNLVLM